jgi:acetyl esterase/lipase
MTPLEDRAVKKTKENTSFNRIPRGWRILLFVLVAIAALIGAAAISFDVWLGNYRLKAAAARAGAVKEDSQLIGARFEVPRPEKDGVEVNLYIPEHREEEKLPVIFNIHGGGFVGNDADALDTQSERYSDAWKSIIVSVNFTKPDIKPIYYGVDEIVDTVLYFARNAKVFDADTEKFSVIGYSSGGFYAAQAAIQLDAQGFRLASQVLAAPWVRGLPKKVSPTLAPALFILGTEDPISQWSVTYQQTLKKAGVEVTTKEYQGGLHPFLDTINPEFQSSATKEVADEYITDEQQALAVKAEADIYSWLQERYEAGRPGSQHDRRLNHQEELE